MRRLTIQRKILLGLIIPALCLIVLTGVSYTNLRLIEQRIRVLGNIDAVETSIMELRRYGKFFLFYGEQADYDAVMTASATATAFLGDIRKDLLFPEPRALVDELVQQLRRYRESITAVKSASGLKKTLGLKSASHELSMDLEDRIMALSIAVRKRITYLSEGLRGQLVAATLVVSGFFALGAYFFRTHVLNPLKVIELTTRQIAQGNYTPVQLRHTHDEIRQLQEAFNRMVAELKSRQEQLVQSQKLSSIGTLSAGIAHQVNNPLNNISLSAQFLRDRLWASAEPLDQKALENIAKETERARYIVRSLLDFSRQSEFCLRRIPLKTVVENAKGFASAQAPPGVRLESDIPDDLMLDLDPQRISEAFLNMIMNGIHAIEETQGYVRLFLDEHAPPGKVTVVIEDSGKGIPPEDLPYIFDPFFTRKEVGRGTGLGLSVAYGIIEECGGTVRVVSDVNKGSRFCIDFPVPGNASPVSGIHAHEKRT